MRKIFPKYVVTAGSQTFFWVLGNIGTQHLPSNDLGLFVKAHLGGFFGVYPEVREDNITVSGSGRRTSSSATAFSVSYGLSAGCSFLEKWNAEISVLFANPEYTFNVHEAHGLTTTASYATTVTKPTSVIGLTVGYCFTL